MTVVAACQVRIDIDDRAGNRERVAAAVVSAAAGGARLVVLPELAVSGYVFADRAEAMAAAEPAQGPTVTEWSALSARHGLVLVGGFCEAGEDGELYNSAVVIDRGQVLAVYRKAHLWDGEKAIFRPGSALPPVLDTSVGRVGVLICYDLEFPEWTRVLALCGAQIVAAPTNWPWDPRPAGERPAEVVRAQAAASVNHLFVVAADRCGAERGVDWVGGSVVVAPSGYPLAGPATPGEPAVLLADIEPAAADDKAISAHNDVLADRRTDLYPPPGVMSGFMS